MEQLPNDIDRLVDDEIFSYLNPANPKSFFLFAGAGSGKTRTLVNVLARFEQAYGEKFRLRRQKIAIITYTNAAADEITRRLQYNSIFDVSTIHSFAWKLISPFNTDIKKWLEKKLSAEVQELTLEQSKSRNLSNKTSIERAKKIESKTKRLEILPSIKKFTYNPSGDNTTRDSLNHAEVIGLIAGFLTGKPLMQQLLSCQYPIVLIDESQDTKKELIDALFALQRNPEVSVCLGLFGDTMQRIYADGKEKLDQAFPKNWKTPAKKINHRSNKRIIRLINKIREDVDSQQQQARDEKPEGFARLFIFNRNADKTTAEARAISKMAAITRDTLWNEESNNVKRLILEHQMAARRMNFSALFAPLYDVDDLTTGLLNGTLAGLNLFAGIILPIVNAHRAENKFEIARIVSNHSPYFSRQELLNSKNQLNNLKLCREATLKLLSLWDHSKDPILLDVLKVVHESKLFQIPASLAPLVLTEKERKAIAENEEEEDEAGRDSMLKAWEQALSTPFSQISNYSTYLSENSKFGTHQGVKGLEFPRVMVIIDDQEAKGFMFSYDKIFGTKGISDTDKKHIKEGRETGIDRTKRLFYVACSRAQESLAIVAYTDDPETLKANVIINGWFNDSEIEMQ